MSPTPQVIESIINSNQKPRIKISYIFVGVPYFVCVRSMDKDPETLPLCLCISITYEEKAKQDKFGTDSCESDLTF